MMTPNDDTSVWAKTALKEFRGNWARPEIRNLPEWVERISESDFITGKQAVYIGTIAADTSGRRFVWLVFDVEAPGKHHDIQSNLDAGRALLAFLFDESLTDLLAILLTGWGLRFIWPVLLSETEIPALIEFVSERNEIDGSIYGTDKFVRLGGYRGHLKQCRDGEPGIDRHVHRLSDPSELWFLTVDDYLTLTAGKPSKSDFMDWLPDVLPKEVDPESWISFLSQYKETIELKGTLFSGTQRKTHRHRRPITEILDEQGIDYITEQSGETSYYRLKKDCPACGKSEGRAWVTVGGRLRCWRATCAAGTPEGLPLSVWLPGVEGYEPDDAAITAPTGETVAVDAIRKAIADGVNSGVDVACRITPGGGKSTSTLKALLSSGLSGRVVFAVPEKSLGRELIETAKDIAPAADVVLLEGRSINNCRNYAKVERIASRGYSPSFLVCPRCKDDDCEYFANQKAAFADGNRLVITSHAGLITGIDWDANDFDKMVIDESPLSTFIQTTAAPWGSVHRIAGMIEPKAQKTIAKIDRAILKQLAVLEKHKKNRYTISRLYAGQAPADSTWDGKKSIWQRAGITDERRNDLHRALSIFERWADDGTGKAESMAKWQRRLYKANVNLDALNNLWALISGDEHTYLNFSQDQNQPVSICHTTKTLPNFSGQTIHLDGTMHPDEAIALFNRDFQIVDGRCELPGLKSVWIRQGGGKLKMSGMSDTQISKMLSAAAVHVPDGAKSILIGTHLSVEPTIKATAKNVMSGRTVDVAHYFSSRGRNLWKDCDAFIAAGTPTPPEVGGLDAGYLLFPGDAERQAEWRSGLGNRELIQMAHRIRPIQGDKTIVVIGREWPGDLGRPTVTIDRRRGDKVLDSAQREAVDRLLPFVQAFGFIHRETMMMHGICLEGEQSICQIAMEFMRDMFTRFHKSSAEKASDTYYNNIGNLRFFSLRKIKGCDELGMIVFKSRESFREIINKLQQVAGLPELSYSSKATNGQKTRGIGFLDSAKVFYESMDVPWAADSWQGTYRKDTKQ